MVVRVSSDQVKHIKNKARIKKSVYSEKMQNYITIMTEEKATVHEQKI
jgi:hypothetical protein